jgi:hypothetical protein
MRATSILGAAGVVTVVLVTAAIWPSWTSRLVTSVHAQNGACSVASLQGAYGFLRTGTNNVLGGPIAVLGLTTFNGDGTASGERESVSRNGVISDWTDVPPTGSYTVDSDCPGSIFDENGNKTQNIVVVAGGDEFLLISTLPGRIVTAVGKKVDAKE